MFQPKPLALMPPVPTSDPVQEPAQFPSSPWSLSWTCLSLCFLLIPPSWPLPSLNFCSTSENQGFPVTPLVSFNWCLFSAKPGKGSQKGRSWFWGLFFFFFFLIPLDWEKITVMMSRSWAFTHLIHESSHLTSQSIYFLIYKMGLITVTPSSGYC